MWVVVAKCGIEEAFNGKPKKWLVGHWIAQRGEELGVTLPKGSIERLLGRKLTYEDGPVEIVSLNINE